MDAPSILLLFIAGFLGGLITGTVGSGTLITLPIMIYVGMPTVVATASSITAVTFGNIAAAAADRIRLPKGDRLLTVLVLISILGGIAGAWMLAISPESGFKAIIPVLVGGATALFACAGTIRRWAGRWRKTPDSVGSPSYGWSRSSTIQLILVAGCAFYGGYFGAGMTVMLLAALSLDETRDFRENNVIKNVLGGLVGIVSMVTYIATGILDWWPTTVAAAGAIIGGIVSVGLVGRIPELLTRALVMGVGAVATVAYASKYW